MASRLGRVPTIAFALAVPLVALVAVVVTLQATSDPTVASAKAPPGTSADTITIANFRYSPDPLVVDAGTTVTVTNRDSTAHTVTANDKSFDTGDLAGGASGTITLEKPGTFKYVCDIHNYMTGSIEVR